MCVVRTRYRKPRTEADFLTGVKKIHKPPKIRMRLVKLKTNEGINSHWLSNRKIIFSIAETKYDRQKYQAH